MLTYISQAVHHSPTLRSSSSLQKSWLLNIQTVSNSHDNQVHLLILLFADITLSLLIAVPLCSDYLSTVCLDIMSILHSSMCTLCSLHSEMDDKEVEAGVMDGHVAHPIFMRKESSITIFFLLTTWGQLKKI